MIFYRVKFFDGFGVLVKSITLDSKPTWGRMIRIHTKAMKAYGGPLDYEIYVVKEEELLQELVEEIKN